jgi:hypothetical protein
MLSQDFVNSQKNMKRVLDCSDYSLMTKKSKVIQQEITKTLAEVAKTLGLKNIKIGKVSWIEDENMTMDRINWNIYCKKFGLEKNSWGTSIPTKEYGNIKLISINPHNAAYQFIGLDSNGKKCRLSYNTVYTYLYFLKRMETLAEDPRNDHHSNIAY